MNIQFFKKKIQLVDENLGAFGFTKDKKKSCVHDFISHFKFGKH